MASSKKESFICEDCGKVKKISPSKRIRYGKYCSKECMSKGNRFKSNCSYCNKEINRKNSQRRKNMFCGADCIYLWRRKRNHPSWIDGRSYLPYPPEFDKDLKFKIKQRDNHVCQLCGEDNPNRTSIHHINYDKFDCSDQNLITLCIVCNSKVNFNRGFWVGYFIGLLRQREIG